MPFNGIGFVRDCARYVANRRIANTQRMIAELSHRVNDVLETSKTIDVTLEVVEAQLRYIESGRVFNSVEYNAIETAIRNPVVQRTATSVFSRTLSKMFIATAAIDVAITNFQIGHFLASAGDRVNKYVAVSHGPTYGFIAGGLTHIAAHTFLITPSVSLAPINLCWMGGAMVYKIRHLFSDS